MYNYVKHLSDKGFKNDIEMLKSLSNKLILAYDPSQILRSGDIDAFTFKKSLGKCEYIKINSQMRMEDSEDYMKWIDNFLLGKLEKPTFKSNYDFKIFDSFSKMHSKIKYKSKKYDLVYLTFGNTRKRKEKTDDFIIDGIHLNWNTPSKGLNKKAWIEIDGAKELREVGYFDYVQGIDMNYSAVIIGKDLTLNSEGELDINDEYVVNRYDKPKKSNLNYHKILKQLILNRYKILLTRGVKGTYIWFEDEKLKAKFS